jgi:hypothetical protein
MFTEQESFPNFATCQPHTACHLYAGDGDENTREELSGQWRL